MNPLTKIEVVKFVEEVGISRREGENLLHMIKNITRRDKHELPLGTDYRFMKNSILEPLKSRLRNAILYSSKR